MSKHETGGQPVAAPSGNSSSIVYIVSQYPAISHTFILGEVNGLKQKGMKVTVTSVNQPDRPYEKLTSLEQEAADSTVFLKSALKKSLPVYVLKTLLSSPGGFFKSLGTALKMGVSSPKLLIKYIAYWLEAMVIADLASKQKTQLMHAHFSSQACTLALLASKINGIDYSVTVHGPDEFYNVNEQQLERKYADASLIVCISDFARSQVMKFSQFQHWSKIRVNNLGVDASLFHPAEKNNPAPVLLCVGRLVNAKGQGVLIEAALKLQQQGVDFKVKFVGDGPDRKSLEAFSSSNGLQDKIEFLGKVNHDQVQVLQREADIFVLPSFAEGIPIALMEAMASGTPCVTTQITGIPELFTDGHDGLLVSAGNADKLANALLELIENPELRKRIAEQALQTVRNSWDLQQSNERLAEIFQQHLSGAAS